MNGLLDAIDLSILENEARKKGYKIIAGVHVEGLGALAGPLVIAACVLPPGLSWKSAKDLQKLFSSHPNTCYSLSVIEPCDETSSTLYPSLLTQVKQTIEELSIVPDFLLIGGPYNPFPASHSRIVPHGDALSYTIGAAALLARTTRDEILSGYDAIYPDYGFLQHRGYPTSHHKKKIEEFGLTSFHLHH